jgi:hypothetical protein
MDACVHTLAFMFKDGVFLFSLFGEMVFEDAATFGYEAGFYDFFINQQQ